MIVSVSLVSGVALFLGAQAVMRPVFSAPCFIVREIEAQWAEENKRPVERYRLNPPTPIFNVDLGGITRVLQHYHPSAQVEAVRRILPNRIMATLKFKRAVLQVRADQYYPISEEGIVMLEGRSAPWPDLPILYVEGWRSPLRVASAFDRAVFDPTAELLALIRRQGGISGHGIGSVRSRGDDLILYLDSGQEIRFNILRLESGCQQLFDLLSQKPEILNGAKYLDFRFEDPVIGAGIEKKARGKR